MPIEVSFSLFAARPIEISTDGKRLVVTPLAADHDEAMAAGR
jgi:hypothetical protein